MNNNEQLGWIFFSIGENNFALEQAKVKSVIETAGLIGSDERGIWITKNEYPIIRTDKNLCHQSGMLRRFGVLIESVQSPIGVLCDQINIFSKNQVEKIYPLPNIFKGTENTAAGFIQFQDESIAMIVDVISLGILLSNLETQYGKN